MKIVTYSEIPQTAFESLMSARARLFRAYPWRPASLYCWGTGGAHVTCIRKAP